MRRMRPRPLPRPRHAAAPRRSVAALAARLLGLIALAVQLAAASVMPAMSAPATPGAICHAAGGVTLAADRPAAKGTAPATPPGHDCPLCPLCLGALADALPPPPASPVAPPLRRPARIAALPASAAPPDRPGEAAAYPRGPPARG